MRSASYQQPSSYRGRASRRSRVTSALLALALVALVIALLIRLGVLPAHLPESAPTLSTFNVLPGRQVAAAPASAKPHHATSTKPPPPKHLPPPPPVPSPHSTPAPKLLTLSKDEFAATDIGHIKGHADEGAAEGTDDGKDSSAAYGPGEGPGGARLYNAQWYREPTHAELAYYIRAGTPTSVAYIECQTIADYHVENCRELGETPPGSGLARALRQAAWQFRVRPPRIGGKPMIGAWVRIRYDFTLLGPE